MRILAVGDVVGDVGLTALEKELKKLKETEKIDFCIVNGENVAMGMGITYELYDKIRKAGADVVTLGNHTWAKKDIFTFIDKEDRIIRPANYVYGLKGRGYVIVECGNKKIAVINLLGRAEMPVQSENPFLTVNKIISNIKDMVDIIVVDFHAEATGELVAMGYYLDKKATVMYGTHTHVQTADEKILEHGLGYITDVGMVGAKNSVIGMDISVAIKRCVTTLPEKYKLATGEYILSGCIFEIDDENNKTVGIKRVNIG